MGHQVRLMETAQYLVVGDEDGCIGSHGSRWSTVLRCVAVGGVEMNLDSLQLKPIREKLVFYK
jgi:ABC-type histidine transport system ATPase subunit